MKLDTSASTTMASPVMNYVEMATAYNEKFFDIPENYKTFKPSRGYSLVKLRKSEVLTSELKEINQETGHPSFEPQTWWGNGDARKGWGMIIASENYDFGTAIITTPAVFYTQVQGVGFIKSPQFVFETPVHSEDGYFLIPNNMIEGSY